MCFHCLLSRCWPGSGQILAKFYQQKKHHVYLEQGIEAMHGNMQLCPYTAIGKRSLEIYLA
jgi:hypothetical protein